MTYSTIVADPPWRYKSTLPEFGNLKGAKRSGTPYPTMTIPEICELPIADLVAKNAHLYLWTTNTHLFEAQRVAKAWGFEYSTALVWCKKPRGFAGFGTFNITTEFVLFCRRGSLKATDRSDTTWFEWPRGAHSKKPEAFLDLVERISPGPYLELFARRNRIGWDTWGNESLNHVEIA